MQIIRLGNVLEVGQTFPDSLQQLADIGFFQRNLPLAAFGVSEADVVSLTEFFTLHLIHKDDINSSVRPLSKALYPESFSSLHVPSFFG